MKQPTNLLTWEPMLTGLEVNEPVTQLEINLRWAEWDAAIASLDANTPEGRAKRLAEEVAA